jgi:hypothetical protein
MCSNTPTWQVPRHGVVSWLLPVTTTLPKVLQRPTKVTTFSKHAACLFSFPASVQEVLDLGVHAIALSRFAGVWSGMKTIQENC